MARRATDPRSRSRDRARRELPGVIHAGNLGDDLIAGGGESLRACYRGALALALASYHETFGMPMLEAMACGTPVVASRASALPEIGGDAALYAPPDDADAWAAALRRIVDDAPLRERLREAGLERAKRFKWDESARAPSGAFSLGRALIALGVDAWNLPGDHRGIGRYLRAILREWWASARDRVEVTLIVPEWHTWTVRRAVSARGGGPAVSRGFAPIPRPRGPRRALVSLQRLQLDELLAAGDGNAARRVELRRRRLRTADASDLSRRGANAAGH